MRRVLGCAALGVALAACPPPDNATVDAPTVFIAYTDTFQPFRTWTSFHSDGPGSAEYPNNPGVVGPRTQYINKLPPTGSTQFPVGTVIVEARENAAMNIFASVKRGAGFNAGGSTGWEYFELTEASGPGSTVTMTWRGVGPPLGDTYGGDPNGCNSCHTMCGSGNDFICSPKLQLKDF
jgi:hypothetical protein